MTDIKLSKRMQAVAELVDEKSVADVGCDHAYISIWLARNGVKKVVAMDVKKGPIEIARANISASGLEHIIDIRHSDGLEALRVGEVSCTVIAGMGGELITNILEKGKRHLTAGMHFVLQPQSEIHKVREFLLNNNYVITNEKMLVEDGKFYNVLKALPTETGGDIYSDTELMYGKLLLDEKNPVLKEYLIIERERLDVLRDSLKNVYTNSSAHRLDMIRNELALINEALVRL